MAPQLVVHLIHGTYAPRAPWIQKDGVLARELEAAFPGRLLVEPCEWTGGNSWDARAEAADKLRSRMEEIHAQQPDARQILVAHSHGGNVALYAMAQMESPNGVVGCCCLATPFLHARLRTTQLFTGQNLGTPIFLVLWVTSLVGTTVFSDLTWRLSIALYFLCLLLGTVGGGFLLGALQTCTGTAEKAALVLQAEAPESVDMLIMRKVGDEASMSLASGQFLAWLSTTAYAFFATNKASKGSRFFRRGPLPRAARWLWLLFALAMAVVVFSPSFLREAHPTAFGLLLVGAGLLFFLALALRTRLLDGVILSSCSAFLAVSKVLNAFAFGVVPYGPDMGGWFRRFLVGSLLSILLDVDTEATPVGFHRVIQFDRSPSAENHGLNHSLYEDPRARALLLRWIQDLEGADAAPSAIGDSVPSMELDRPL